MKIPDVSRDPPRDPEMVALLGRLRGDAPGETPDWEGLRGSIAARAALPLAALRSRPSWWEYAARWARPAIPLAAAAGLALAVLVGSLPAPGTGLESIAAGLPLLEDVVAASVPDAEYQLLLAGGSESDALLRMAFQEP